MKHLENFGEYDKDKMMARFKEMKSKGGSFSLADIARDSSGNLPKINSQKDSEINISADDLKVLTKYHKKAIKVAKYAVSEIKDLQTEEGLRKGFTYGDNMIFSEDDIILVESPDDESHEISLYEIDEL